MLAYQRRCAWPRLLGERLRCELVVNEAMGGGSNARAVRMALRFVAGYLADGGEPGDLLVCIGLTDLKRGEHHDEDGGGGEDDGWWPLKPRLSGPNAPTERYLHRRNRLYYRHLYSERQAVATLVQQVLLLQSTLDAHGVRLHLHEAMPVNRAPLERWLPRTPEARLIEPDRQPMARAAGGSRDRSFEEWATEEAVATGPHGHPLLAGHRGWADVIHAELAAGGLLDGRRR